MSKYYLIKTDTNDKIDTELYLDKLSKGYVELTEEELEGIAKNYEGLQDEYGYSIWTQATIDKIRKVLENEKERKN